MKYQPDPSTYARDKWGVKIPVVFGPPCMIMMVWDKLSIQCWCGCYIGPESSVDAKPQCSPCIHNTQIKPPTPQTSNSSNCKLRQKGATGCQMPTIWSAGIARASATSLAGRRPSAASSLSPPSSDTVAFGEVLSYFVVVTRRRWKMSVGVTKL